MISFCKIKLDARCAYWIIVDRGTLSFDGVDADISAGRFCELVAEDGCVPVVAGISGAGAEGSLWYVA
jgi:hypothetical protein